LGLTGGMTLGVQISPKKKRSTGGELGNKHIPQRGIKWETVRVQKLVKPKGSKKKKTDAAAKVVGGG